MRGDARKSTEKSEAFCPHVQRVSPLRRPYNAKSKIGFVKFLDHDLGAAVALIETLDDRRASYL